VPDSFSFPGQEDSPICPADTESRVGYQKLELAANRTIFQGGTDTRVEHASAPGTQSLCVPHAVLSCEPFTEVLLWLSVNTQMQTPGGTTGIQLRLLYLMCVVA